MEIKVNPEYNYPPDLKAFLKARALGDVDAIMLRTIVLGYASGFNVFCKYCAKRYSSHRWFVKHLEKKHLNELRKEVEEARKNGNKD